MPICAESAWVPAYAGMTSAGDLGEVGDVEGGGADLGQQGQAVGAQAAASVTPVTLTVTLSKKASTGARSSASARMAPAKFSTLMAATVSPFTFWIAS